MKFYYTNFYQSYKGQTRNIIYILNEEERLLLAEAIKQLLDDRQDLIDRGMLEYHYTKNGTLSKRSKPHPERYKFKKYWNGKDEESVEFLKRLCYFSEFPESVMLDPTDYQLEGMVDKMLEKVYGKFYGKFSNWLELKLEGEMTRDELRKHMDKKRALFAKVKRLGWCENIESLPY